MNTVKNVFVMVFASWCFAHAQTPQEDCRIPEHSEDALPPFQRFARDLWIQASSPFHMNETNMYWVAAGLVTTSAFMFTDQGTNNTVKDIQSDVGVIGGASLLPSSVRRMHLASSGHLQVMASLRGIGKQKKPHTLPLKRLSLQEYGG